jgi:hypothetical protein
LQWHFHRVAPLNPSWNLEVLIFAEGGKTREPGKNPQSKGENQQTTLLTYDAKSGNNRMNIRFSNHTLLRLMLP